ncbi:ECF-type sigma factor [Pseudomarimonas arenosa]|uniref:Sigma-70 family RNA polymerase sigma factor n=1 Tax=Pseudomarimonas arenosa TaxID=2774145 RepID=A0AAW3ZNG4_9GAMM|nr:sigma-70 family RNA polymerase sigma factor [Pseudomarimonas arenosa]
MKEGEITQLLESWKQGDRSCEGQLANLIYPVLLDIARAQARRHRGSLTLSATEVAHEAFERIYEQRAVDWQNRAHFYAIAATVIRRVVVDYLRQRGAEKRGGDVDLVPLDSLQESEQPSAAHRIDWLDLDRLLIALGQEDPAAMKVVEMRVFAGLSVEEIATATQSSVATVGRQWRFARAWLGSRLQGDLGVHD